MIKRQRLTLLYVLETIIIQIAYLENVSVSNNCTIHKLSIVTGYICLKECHSVNSSTTEGCGRSIHAQTAARHCSRTMGTDRISFITCCNLFNHEAICEFALPCEALRIQTVFHHVTDIYGTVLAHRIEKKKVEELMQTSVMLALNPTLSIQTGGASSMLGPATKTGLNFLVLKQLVLNVRFLLRSSTPSK